MLPFLNPKSTSQLWEEQNLYKISSFECKLVFGTMSNNEKTIDQHVDEAIDHR